MRNKQDFTLDVISSIDEDIVNDNLNKRFALWFSRAQKKKNHWIPIVAMAAVFALILSSIFLFLPDNSHVAPPSDKQVPIYQGMTVSNEAPVVEMATRVNYSMPLFGAIGARFGTSSIPGTSTTPKPDKVTPEISGGPYYAQPNEDIYIHVHISNPDGFEILSFTLNGVKYSSYMFEAGSDLETLILKYNVGEEEGVQQYTIDAIKYVDGEDIKDVRMEGDRTIEVLVGNDAQDLTFTTQFDGWDLVIEPQWTEAFTGEKKILSLAVYEGERLLRELDPSDRTISDLPMDKRLLLVATYLDNSETITVTTVIQTRGQSEGLLIVNGVVTGSGTCTDTVLYINMPIVDMAFKNNKQITQVYLGSGVTTIGSEAFSGCTKLTDIVIPSTVTGIGHGVFAGCTSLTSVALENVLISIPNTDNLFYNCTSLTSVTIPDSVTSIGKNAFAGCAGLTSITVPNSVTSIGENAFAGCTGLTRFTIPDSVTSIGENTFAGCTGLTSVTIPNSVTIIGLSAFNNCKSLTSITIPDRVTGIDESAFSDCSSLTSITIPDSVTSIGFSAFNGCSGLTSMTLPFVGEKISGNSIMHFGYYFGAENSNSVPSTLKTVVVTSGVIPQHAFSGCSNLTSITISDSVTSIGFSAFNGCSGLTSMTLPFVGEKISSNSIMHFGYYFGAEHYGEEYAWYNNGASVPSALTTVVVTSGVIPELAFANCSSLTSITIGDGVTNIRNKAFYMCTSLTSITIGDSVRSIGPSAFQLCSSLTSITIPDSVTSIGEYAFSQLGGSLPSINYTGTKAQWSAVIKTGYWKDSSKIPVHCSDGDVIGY